MKISYVSLDGWRLCLSMSLALSGLVACEDKITSCEDTVSCVEPDGEGGGGGDPHQEGDGDDEETGPGGSGNGGPVEPCEEGTWDHDADPDTTCKKWSACTSGEWVEEEGSPTTDRSCAPCAEGTYSDRDNSVECAGWTQCPSGVVQAGTATEDHSCASPATDVAVGQEFGCVLREDSTVACFGSNNLGQLGHGDTGYGRFPVQVMVQTEEGLEALTDVVQLSAGATFACALRGDASVWCWGDNGAGQLGTGTYDDGDFVPYAIEVEGVPSVSHLDAAQNFACAVLDDHTARCWGAGGNSLGLGGGGEDRGRIVTVLSPSGDGVLSGVTRIAAGGPHTCAATEDGTAYCWGAAQYGEVPAPFPGSNVPVPAVSDDHFVDVAAGTRVSCFQSDDGHVSCLGIGPFGSSSTENRDLVSMPLPEDEEGNLAPRVVDVEVDETVRCMLFEDGSVRCWGYNQWGQLGNGSTDDAVALVEVKDLENIVAMDAGHGHACAVDDTGRVFCWGNNENGQLGDGSLFGSTTPLAVGGVSDVVDVVSGSNHSCALHESGRVTCWGNNENGQLGLDSDEPMSGPQLLSGVSDVLHLSAKANLTFATKKDHSVRAWGTGLMGALSSSTVENVNGLQDVASVAPGMDHACAVHEDGKLSCWGDNTCSQAGPDVNEANPVNTPTQVTTFPTVDAAAGGTCHSCVLINGEVSCWGGHALGEAGSVGALTPAVNAEPVAQGVRQIAAGLGHNLALTEDGAVLAWGFNDEGQLGYPIIGSPNSVEAQPVDDLDKAVAVAAGENHSCAVLETGEVACWGSNVAGQLGRGLISDYDVDAELVEGLHDVKQLSAGASHTCALHQDGTVSCWGANDAFQLGTERELFATEPREVVWRAE